MPDAFLHESPRVHAECMKRTMAARSITVSVIIPARNAGRWISDAIRSVAAQTLAAHEIIVVDDASTDETCPVVERLRETLPQLILIRNAEGLGPAASRNIGINRASGEWLAFLDADDWFVPTRLARLTHLGESSGARVVADNQFFTHGGPGDLPFRTLIQACGWTQWIGLEAFLRGDRIVANGNLGLIKPIVRREFLHETKLRYDEAISVGEDSLFYISCLLAGSHILLTHEPLYFYRRHRGSLSRGVSPNSVRALKHKNLALLARARAGATLELGEAIDQRLADLDKMVVWREMVAEVQAGRWVQAALCLASSRNHALFLLWRLVYAIWHRAEESRLWRCLRLILRGLPIARSRYEISHASDQASPKYSVAAAN